MNDEPQADRSPALPPRPKPFHVTEPTLQNSIWTFWLTADEPVLRYVSHLNCVLSTAQSPFARRPNGRVLVSINPRYDHLEAWTWICQLLETETRMVDLGESWEEAINLACEADEEP